MDGNMESGIESRTTCRCSDKCLKDNGSMLPLVPGSAKAQPLPMNPVVKPWDPQNIRPTMPVVATRPAGPKNSASNDRVIDSWLWHEMSYGPK